ncbi:MAG: flagellar FliJ family protein [Oscillospiraceae bacterium]|nr:flagellar FliJ family protein [Oscillospiraceae bacterium]MBQ8883038.1 flagellar FliJ family protein [Oscillospiraceae bacterium]
MKKYEFSLKRILDYKNQMLNREKNTLLGLRMERKGLEDKIEDLDRQYELINLEMHEKFKDGMTVSQINVYEFRKTGVREEKRAILKRIALLDISIERQQKKVVTAKQEVSGLEKLEEKQLEEYNAAYNKEQEDIIAEFVSTSFTREEN